MKLLFLLFSALFISLSLQQQCCTSCATPFTFTAAANVGAMSQYRPRNTSVGILSIPGLGVGVLVKSYSITRAPGEISIDLIRASVVAINLLIAPTASVGFWNRASDSTDGVNGYDYTVTQAGNFAAHRYFSLDEVAPNGAVINTILFRTLNWGLVQTGTCGNAGFFAISATATGATFGTVKIELNFIAVNVSGTVAFVSKGNTISAKANIAILGTKSFEHIVTVDLTQYTYQSNSNFIRLNNFVAVGNSNRFVNISSPNPLTQGQVFCNVNGTNTTVTDTRFNIATRFSTVAYLKNGAVSFTVGISLQSSTNATIFNGDAVTAQITSKFGATGFLTYVPVTFPNGTQDVIVYDPATVSGTDAIAVNTLSSAASLSVSVLLLIALILFFF